MARRDASSNITTVNYLFSPAVQDKCDLIGKKLYNRQQTVAEENMVMETNRIGVLRGRIVYICANMCMWIL